MQGGVGAALYCVSSFKVGVGGGGDMEVRMGREAGSCQQKKQFRAVRLTYFLR